MTTPNAEVAKSEGQDSATDFETAQGARRRRLATERRRAKFIPQT